MTSPNTFLADVVARHFDGADVLPSDSVDAEAPVVVRLLGPLPRIECQVSELQRLSDDIFSAAAYLTLTGGALGDEPTLVTVSGYGDSAEAALNSAGCEWSCAFGPVLVAALTGTRAPDECLDVEVDHAGRRFRLVANTLDRRINEPLDDLGRQWRQRHNWATVRALQTCPDWRAPQPLTVGTFVAQMPNEYVAEIKFAGRDWSPGLDLWRHDAIPDLLLMREFAVAVPLTEPAALTRAQLAETFRRLAAADSDGQGFFARSHRWRLGDPVNPEAVQGFPEDYAQFVTTVMASGAGPGTGLVGPRREADYSLLARGGCGGTWWLRLDDPERGTVWCDRGDGEPPERVADSFTQWYEAWLTAAGRDDAFVDWSVCAGRDVLRRMLEQDVDPSTSIDAGAITITGPEGTVVGPCEACVRTYRAYGAAADVFRWPE